jgi:hypothetical protein
MVQSGRSPEIPVRSSRKATNSGEVSSRAMSWSPGPGVGKDVAVLRLVDVQVALPELVVDAGELLDGHPEGLAGEHVVHDDVGKRHGLGVLLGLDVHVRAQTFQIHQGFPSHAAHHVMPLGPGRPVAAGIHSRVISGG